MKRFVRALCIAGLAFGMLIGAGAFLTASAGSDGYYGHSDHHYRAHYWRAYDHCASRYRVGGYRFQRCMDYQLEEYRRW